MLALGIKTQSCVDSGALIRTGQNEEQKQTLPAVYMRMLIKIPQHSLDII